MCCHWLLSTVIYCLSSECLLSTFIHAYLTCPPCSSLSTPQLGFPSWGCPQWQCHTELEYPRVSQQWYQVLSVAAVICWTHLFEHNWQHHHDCAIQSDCWHPVRFHSEGLHCGLWAIQWSTSCTHSWWWVCVSQLVVWNTVRMNDSLALFLFPPSPVPSVPQGVSASSIGSSVIVVSWREPTVSYRKHVYNCNMHC